MTVKELKVLLEEFDESADAVMTVHVITSVGTVPTTSGKPVCINAEYFK